MKALFNYASRKIGNRSWLEFGGREAGISSRWLTFPETEVARMGIKGLTGCTGIILLSNEGAWIGHMWEEPTFKVAEGLTPMDMFQASTFHAFNNNIFGAETEPLAPHIGTDQEPGPLHHSKRPRIIAVSPYTDKPGSPLRYHDQVKWLTQQFSRLLYPQGTQKDTSTGYMGTKWRNKDGRTVKKGYMARLCWRSPQYSTY